MGDISGRFSNISAYSFPFTAGLGGLQFWSKLDIDNFKAFLIIELSEKNIFYDTVLVLKLPKVVVTGFYLSPDVI